MTGEQVKALVEEGELSRGLQNPQLVETHISWVLIGDEFVYKIKKPVHYSFLDFSTKEKRKFYCEREIVLNNRFTRDIYLKVVPISEKNGKLVLDGGQTSAIDYAVKMRKLDRSRQMDRLIIENKVTEDDIRNLAEKVAGFHRQAEKISKVNIDEIRDKFNDLEGQAAFLEKFLKDSSRIISNAVRVSTAFLEKQEPRFEQRLRLGFFRDCHGDLHSRNIFLLPDPTPFDCLEFNDEFRYMDVLDEVAFLCMDLDAFARRDLSELFIFHYDRLFHTIESDDDRQMFIYYKAYRANIRAKVNSLRAAGFESDAERKAPLEETSKYLQLMNGYIQGLKI